MIKAVLTDIEGTTSSLSFVRDVLFPYATEKLPEFVHQHQNDACVQVQLEAVRQELNDPQASIEVLIETLLEWIRQDRKITPLKTLQGMIWEKGYRDQEYCAHVYPDAHAALAHWKSKGITLWVYSSGSVAAQTLFFQYSDFGDMTPMFSGYFDTTTGPKQAADSYRAIQSIIHQPASSILFLSDIEGELNAAREVGMHTIQLIRTQEYPVVIGDSTHRVATSFSEIII